MDQLGIAIAPKNARTLAEAGIQLKDELAKQVAVRHPRLAGLDEIAYVMFRGIDPDGAIRTCTTLRPGRVDRSPCGTGSSANLAVLHARGQIKVGDVRRSRSIIGGEFTAEAIGETTVAAPCGAAADHRPSLGSTAPSSCASTNAIRSRMALRCPIPGERTSTDDADRR